MVGGDQGGVFKEENRKVQGFRGLEEVSVEGGVYQRFVEARLRSIGVLRGFSGW